MARESSLKVSVIVPVYNMGKYIEHCLESLVKQTYKNIEIILIDSGSYDESKEIINKYKNKYKNQVLLKTVVTDNIGVSHARNIGILHSSGDLLTFVDADDYVSKYYIEKMIKFYKIDYSNTGLVLCDYYTISNGEECLISNKINLNKINDLLNVLSRVPGGGYVWNKLFRIDVIQNNKLFFSENLRILEDFLFCVEYLNYCKNYKVCYLDEGLYYYVQRNNSIVHEKESKRSPNKILAMSEIIEKIDNTTLLYTDICKDLVNLKVSIFYGGGNNDISLRKFILDIWPDRVMLTKKHKLMYYVCLITPFLALPIVKVHSKWVK